MNAETSGPPDTTATSASPRRHSAEFALTLVVIANAMLTAVVALVNMARFGIRIPSADGMLFRPADRFSDLYDPVFAAATRNPFSGFITPAGIAYPEGINYPPGIVPILRTLSLLSDTQQRGVLVIALALSGSALLYAIAFARLPVRRGVLAAIFSCGVCTTYFTLDEYPLVCLVVAVVSGTLALASAVRNLTLAPVAIALVLGTSFPVVFAIDRMNVDIAVFAVGSLAAILAYRSRTGGAALLVGAAIAMKIFPFALLELFERTRIRETARTVMIIAAAAVVATAIGIASTDHSPTAVAHGFSHALKWVNEKYVIGNAGMPYGYALFTGAKAVYVQATDADPTAYAARMSGVWSVLWIPMTAAAMLVVWLLRFPRWSRVMIAVCLVLLLSPISGSYRAIYLLIPIACWIEYVYRTRAMATRNEAGWTRAVALTIGIALTPKALWTISTFVTADTILQPVGLTLLLITSVGAGWSARSRSRTT